MKAIKILKYLYDTSLTGNTLLPFHTYNLYIQADGKRNLEEQSWCTEILGGTLYFEYGIYVIFYMKQYNTKVKKLYIGEKWDIKR